MAAGKKTMEPTILYSSDFYKSGKWIIEIVTLPLEYEFWLSYENYGVKEMCFGSAMDQTDKDEFLRLVEDNLYREKITFAYMHEEDEFEI